MNANRCAWHGVPCPHELGHTQQSQGVLTNSRNPRVSHAPTRLAVQVPHPYMAKCTKKKKHENRLVGYSPTPRWSISCPPPSNRSPSVRAEGPRVVWSIQAVPAPTLTPSTPISACLAAAALAGSQAGPAQPVATALRLPSVQVRQSVNKLRETVPNFWGDKWNSSR